MLKSIAMLLMCLLIGISSAQAAYVAMAQFDINGDGEDEIVRAEGTGETTAIKIYEKIDKSYFFKPVEVIDVQGNLVQVPEVADFTGDAILDLYFATGSDMGIIYYDTVEETYKREYEVDSDLTSLQVESSQEHAKILEKAKIESDIFLKMQTEPIDSMDNSQQDRSLPLPTKSDIQTI